MRKLNHKKPLTQFNKVKYAEKLNMQNLSKGFKISLKIRIWVLISKNDSS